MQSLSRLAALWNGNTALPTANLITDSLQEYYSRLILESDEAKAPLRMSMMGKPLVELAYAIHIPKEDSSSRADLFRASVGVWCEALLVSMAADAGLNITDTQKEVTLDFPGFFTLVGHIDGISDGDTIFDFKCISGTYFNKFSTQLDDERGYISQLALYQCATKMPKAAFFLVNSQNGYAKVVPVPQRRLTDAITTVKDKLTALFTKPAQAIIAEEKRKLGGKIPANLKFSKYLRELKA